MKSLQDFASRYNCTLMRACTEILTPNNARSERCPDGGGRPTMEPVAPESEKKGLRRKTKAYRQRRIRQIQAGMP